VTTITGASPSQISAKRRVWRASLVSRVSRRGVEVDDEVDVDVEGGGAADASDVVGGGTSLACTAAVATLSPGSVA
jgi:hypothetical protein